MRDFFKDWHRPTSFTLVVMALIVFCLWIVSRTRLPHFGFLNGDTYYSFGPARDYIAMLQLKSIDVPDESESSTRWDRETFSTLAPLTAERVLSVLSTDEAPVQWQRGYLGLDVGDRTFQGSSGAIHVHIRKLPYWCILVPLTLFSTYLLRGNPRTPLSPEKPVGGPATGL